MSYFEAKMHQIRFHSAPQMSALENGKTTMQEYKQRYLYIFKMANKPEVVIGLHLEPVVVAHDRMNLK